MMRKNPVCRNAGADLKYALDHLNPGISRMHTLMLDHGKGSYVWDVEGKKYLDFTCGIGVTNLGHSHPRLVAAVKQQVEKAWHLQVCTGPHTTLLKLIQGLETIFPKQLNNFMFVTTGAEAVEAALKLSRAATGRANCAALQGGYHGRTVGAAALTTSKYVYHRGLRPLMPGVTIIPAPYASQMALPADYDTDKLVDMALAQAETLLWQTTHPSEVSMIIAEPTLGEGGYVPMPKRYYKGLRELCTKHGILLCIDEVQSGFGRTGTMFQFEQLVDKDSNGEFVEGQLPDIVCFAKGVANGLPLAGIVTRKELSDKQLSGQQGGTYAANAVACASAVEVVKVLEEEGILKNVAERSVQLVDGLKHIVKSNNLPMLEVRGRGLMIGMQFDDSVPAGTAAKIANAALDNGLLLLNTSKYEALRMIPPLNVSKAEMDEGLGIVEKVLKAALPAGTRKTTSFKPCCEDAKQCVPGKGPCRWTVRE
jgi:4-aminobutyrate aminotransferase